MKDPLFLVIDLFCGAGGTTCGFVQAELEGTGIAKVIACVNHDPKAIESHWKNHPEVKHFEEDIRTLDLTELVALTNYSRKKYPNALVILWASLECTNFSKAKGGLPRDADSRTLAEHLDRYIVSLQPDYIQIENVVEFMSWGPLDDKGKPISRKNGADWLRWRKEMCAHGYIDHWNELNSANFGAYTSRNRLFGVFARPGLPTVWPEPTHAKKPSKHGMHGDLQKWNACREVLDFSDKGESIIIRDKSIVDKSLERVYAGLVRFVAHGDTSFIQKHFSGKPHGKVIPTDGPAGTITTSANQSLVQVEFLMQNYAANSKGHNTFSVDKPARTITTRDSTKVVQATFLANYYGTGGQHSSIDNPAPTIPTRDRIALVSPEFLTIYNGKSQHRNVDEPAPVIACNDRLSLIQPQFLLNPQWGGHSGSIDEPCPVIIARQDKSPLYLVQLEAGTCSIPIYEDDSEVMKKIKLLMAAYNIVDIKMRMLRVHELLKIQGFPADYKLEGNQADQKKFIGNSVVPLVVKRWTEALAMRLIQGKVIHFDIDESNSQVA